MKTLDDFIDIAPKSGPSVQFTEILKLARTKYADNWAVQKALEYYMNGIEGPKIKGKKTEGIPPYSDYARNLLIKCVDIRERGLIYPKRN